MHLVLYYADHPYLFMFRLRTVQVLTAIPKKKKKKTNKTTKQRKNTKILYLVSHYIQGEGEREREAFIEKEEKEEDRCQLDLFL